MDEIIVSSTEALYEDYDDLKSQIPSGYAPYSLAGINDNGAIFGNSEWDYPAPVCEDCEKPLNVNLLVCKSYKSYAPLLHLRLRMTEEFGGCADTDCLTAGEI